MRSDQFVRFFVLPEVWASSDHNRRGKIAFFVLLCFSIISLVSIRAIHLFFAQPDLHHLIALPMCIVLGAISSLGILRWRGHLVFASHLILILIAIMVIVGTVIFQQGTASVVTRWVPAIPLAATLLLGLRGGRLWAILSIFLMVLLHFGFHPGEGHSEDDHLNSTAATILTTLFCFLIAYFYESMRVENERVLQEKIDSRINFLKTANEQLRAPAIMLSEVSEALTNTKPSDEQKPYVEAIKKASLSIDKGVKKLLDATKHEIREELTSAEPFSVFRLLNDVVGFLKGIISARSSQISFEVIEETPAILVGDAEKISQIIYNLINGCISQISSANIKIQASSDQGNRFGLLLSVQINSEFLSKFRIETDTAGYRLAIKYIDQLGGSLRSNVEEGGSSFLIKLPLQKPTALEEATFVKTNRPSKMERPPTALLVDDSPESLLLLSKILGDLKFNISQSLDGVLAIEKFKDEYFDLVIMDLAMPNLDGFSAIHKMRDLELEELRPPTHIIVISGTDSADDIRKALLVGANDHIAKPIVKRIIVEKISSLAPETQILD